MAEILTFKSLCGVGGGGGWVPMHRLVTATVKFGCDNLILQELVMNWKSDELPLLEEDLIYFDAISCKRLFPINSSSFQGNSLITVGEIQLHFISIFHKFLMLLKFALCPP